MSVDPNEVVKVYAGPLVAVESYQMALKEAGIESHVAGTALLAGFGSALPGAIELYVHQRDAEKAVAAIRRYEENRPEGSQPHPRPRSDADPTAVPHGKEPHVKQDPLGE